MTPRPKKHIRNNYTVAISSWCHLITLATATGAIIVHIYVIWLNERNGRKSRESKPLAFGCTLLILHTSVGRITQRWNNNDAKGERREKEGVQQKENRVACSCVCNVHLIMPPDFIISRLFLFFNVFRHYAASQGILWNVYIQIYMHKKI